MEGFALKEGSCGDYIHSEGLENSLFHKCCILLSSDTPHWLLSMKGTPPPYLCFYKSETRRRDTSSSNNQVISTRPKNIYLPLMAGITNWVLDMDGKLGSIVKHNYWLCESCTCN